LPKPYNPEDPVANIYTSMHDLVHYLREHVPLTRHIDIHAGLHTAKWFELNAPLAPNLNDKHTAFGGTLATLCTLSGWCVVSYLCREADIKVDIAVTESHIRYHMPVTSDPVAARTWFPDQALVDSFVQDLNQQGKTRLELRAEVKADDQVAASFNSEYYVRVL